MEKPIISGWEVTHSEKGVELATVNREKLVQLINYSEEITAKYNRLKHLIYAADRTGASMGYVIEKAKFDL